MASSFEKSVKGATKVKVRRRRALPCHYHRRRTVFASRQIANSRRLQAAPPKTKYIEHILIATHAGEAGVGEVFRALQYRLRDSTWTIVFKSLITVHLMIREGSPDVTLAYLAKHKNILAVSVFSDGQERTRLNYFYPPLTLHRAAQTQGRNIRHYSNYLTERSRAYRETKVDWVRAKEPRLEKLSVEKGLLRETEVVQHQLTALLKCDVMETEPENEITITVFRLLVLDLLALFQILNQALINILGKTLLDITRPSPTDLAVHRPLLRIVQDGRHEGDGDLPNVHETDGLCGAVPQRREAIRAPH